MENQTELSNQKATYIPVSQELVNHVKRLDGFNEDELITLKSLLFGLFNKDGVYIPLNSQTLLQNPVQQDQEQLPEAQADLLSITLKLHQVMNFVLSSIQVFALADIDLSKLTLAEKDATEENGAYLTQLVSNLSSKGGLDYIPRERTPQGRMFEHASDSKILLQVILKLKSQPNDQVPQSQIHYIKILNEQVEDDQEAINDKDSRTFLTIRRNFVTLTMNANGKAELYFHAYIWVSILQQYHARLNKDGENLDQAFDSDVVAKSIDVMRLKGLVESLKRVDANLKKFPFGESQYQRFVKELAQKQIAGNKVKYLEEIQRSLFVAQISDDTKTLQLIEKLLIQLLGHQDMTFRDQAVKLLNMLYDGIDWQLQQAFRPVVRVVGQHFKVSAIVNLDLSLKENSNAQIFIGLSAPSPVEGIHKTILTWHKIDKRNIISTKGIETEIGINFGKFWKCGFYDWRLILVKDTGKLQNLEIIGKPEPSYPVYQHQSDYDDDSDDLGAIAQGRFIVHAKGIRDQILHEVQIDFQSAEVDSKQGKFIKRGDFAKVEKAIPEYKSRGITALYLMGVLERDNNPKIDVYTGQTEYLKPESNPLAITCRKAANTMLGGETGFKKVMNQAKQNKIKVIIDCLSRVSSARPDRAYRNLLLHYLDENGKSQVCYGTDGHAVNYDDTALLNYRKVESWNLLISEVQQFIENYGVNGIHLDNGQAWPQILQADLEELFRCDHDGQPAYTPDQIMNGEVVIRNENAGYWNTNMMEKYPNPFFIKLAKSIWEKNPDFMIIGECWGGYLFENRQIILARSGIIPRLFKFPQAISSLFGKKLHKDGRVSESDRENVIALRKWYENNRKFLPDGSILIQSSSAHQWPYPAYLYGKGTWAAVDILYFMPDIPITFMGEIDGEVYRIGTTQLFQHEQQQTNKTLKRSNSQLMMALQSKDDNDDYEPDQEQMLSQEKSPEGKKGLTRVRSGSNLAAVVVESSKGADLKLKEQQFKAQIGPQQGFDLTQINSHYESRRRLRREKMVLRYGELVPLVARHNDGWHNHVLSFARYSLLETAIISINLNDSEVNFYIDTSALQDLYSKNYSNNTVIMVTNSLNSDQQAQYYFLREYMSMKHYQVLKPYHSSVYCVQICQDDQFVFKRALTQSLERTKQKLLNGENIESEQISLLITDIVENSPEDLIKFANAIGSLQENFLEKLNIKFLDLFMNNQKLKNNAVLAARVIAFCQRIVEIAEDSELPPKTAAKSLSHCSTLGPIIFCAPELGRWSTVGGLGVMVDELSIGLAALGQDVYVISPYYEKNRKGESGYLAKDPAGIHYVDNIEVSFTREKVTLGVHEGVVSGVKVIFLHNEMIFPMPYPDIPPAELMRQLAVFNKGCLEFCCAKGIIPSVCVTNDWFTGLIPGYAKVGAFGDTFRGTTFLHIAHNLEPSYEGRIFPAPNQGALEAIHELPRDFFVDPHWQGCIVNPSRCAIMLSDQWATVSPSYKEDLLRSSTLRGLLQQKPQPFAFPNGIPVQARIKKLNEAAPDHLAAKRIIQKKYFGFQDLDDDVCLLSFVGRITEQKGVHLILDAAEQLIEKYNHKINILVGGMVNFKEQYSAICANKMVYLKQKYPNCFWADPQAFFTDGSVVNRGSDFGLMPSIFEPGGIVQHEFFVGGTPVVAFKTGGLKDSVFEFMWDTEQGNGYTFESHTKSDFIFACERAIGTFKNKAKYARIRENAFNSTMDGEVVSKAWLKEFCRLRGKVHIEQSALHDALNKMRPWAPETYKPMSSFEEMFGSLNNEDKVNFKLDDIDLGAEEEKELLEEEKNGSAAKRIVSHFEQTQKEDLRFPHVFMMHNHGPKYESVELCGSMDDWKIRHPMSFDHFTNQWFITLHLKKGKYYYKYVTNNKNWVVNDKEPKEKDPAGNLNNVLAL